MARSGKAWSGLARHGKAGFVRQSKAGFDAVRYGSAGWVRQGLWRIHRNRTGGHDLSGRVTDQGCACGSPMNSSVTLMLGGVSME